MQRAISVVLFPFAVLRLRIIRNRGRARLFGRRYRYTVLENRGRRVWKVTPIERKGLVVWSRKSRFAIQSVGRLVASSLKIINIAILTNAPRGFTNCPSSSRLRRIFLVSLLKINTPDQPSTPHRGIIEDIFKCVTSTPRWILRTCHDIICSPTVLSNERTAGETAGKYGMAGCSWTRETAWKYESKRVPLTEYCYVFSSLVAWECVWMLISGWEKIFEIKVYRGIREGMLKYRHSRVTCCAVK